MILMLEEKRGGGGEAPGAGQRKITGTHRKPQIGRY
jgi:hypothetical protein